MPLVKAITSKSDLPPEQQDAADAVMAVFGHIRGPFSILLHSPEVAKRLLPMVTFVRKDTIVEPQVRFLAILAAARECQAEYVWAAQIEQAQKNGIPTETIELVRRRASPEQYPEHARDVVRFVEQMMRERHVDRATFDALRTRHGEQWLVELAAIVQLFVFVAGICNVFEVPAPQGGVRIPD